MPVPMIILLSVKLKAQSAKQIKLNYLLLGLT
jgi:hypothetical protein